MSIFFLQLIIEIVSNKKDGRVERAGREGRASLTRCHLTKDLIEVREKLGNWGKCLQAEGTECTKVFKEPARGPGRWLLSDGAGRWQVMRSGRWRGPSQIPGEDFCPNLCCAPCWGHTGGLALQRGAGPCWCATRITLAANPNPNPDLWKLHYGAVTLEARRPVGRRWRSFRLWWSLSCRNVQESFEEPQAGRQGRRTRRVQPRQQRDHPTAHRRPACLPLETCQMRAEQ